MKAYINEKVISYKPAIPDTIRFGGASNAQAESGIEIRTVYDVTSVALVSGFTNVFTVIGKDGDGNTVQTNVDCDTYNLILMS